MRFLTPAEIFDLAKAIHARATILTEVKGKLTAGLPKTRAGRRTVGLPPFVVGELEAHLAAVQRPGSHVVTAPVGGRCGSRAFGHALGCRLPRQPTCRGPAHPRPSPHRRGAVDRRRRHAQEVAVRAGAYPGIPLGLTRPWPPSKRLSS
jgi:hypothetical protein